MLNSIEWYHEIIDSCIDNDHIASHSVRAERTGGPVSISHVFWIGRARYVIHCQDWHRALRYYTKRVKGYVRV
jgi:hypothetical protein